MTQQTACCDIFSKGLKNTRIDMTRIRSRRSLTPVNLFSSTANSYSIPTRKSKINGGGPYLVTKVFPMVRSTLFAKVGPSESSKIGLNHLLPLVKSKVPLLHPTLIISNVTIFPPAIFLLFWLHLSHHIRWPPTHKILIHKIQIFSLPLLLKNVVAQEKRHL